MMSPISWMKHKQIIESWHQARSPHYSLTFAQKIEQLIDEFTDLVDYIERKSEEMAQISRRDLVLFVAVLGIQSIVQTPMPNYLWKPLIRLGKRMSPQNERATLFEVAMAFGCGWKRTILPGNDPWEGVWLGSVLGMRILAERSVNQSMRMISRRLIDERNALVNEAAEWNRAVASVISLELINEKCRCGKHQPSCKSKNGKHDCHNECCRQEHQLSSWNPDVCSLQGFVAQAIRGSAAKNLKTGLLNRSMLYPYLQEEWGIQIGPVEFKVCPTFECSTNSVTKALAKFQEPKGKEIFLYQGHTCPQCKRPAALKTTYYKARKNWLLIPYEDGGNYESLNRWRCKRCRNLYPVNLSACPLCKELTPQRQFRVWVYFSRRQFDDDELVYRPDY